MMADLRKFAATFQNMNLSKVSNTEENKALVELGKLKGYLNTIEGLFTGFKNNLT